MSLIKWSHDLPSIFEDILEFGYSPWSNMKVRATAPLVNVKDTETEFTLEVLAPKMAPEDFKIEVEKNELHITVQNEVKIDDSNNGHLQEYRFSYSDRSFRLPSNADTENITATTEKGIILIHIPKLPEEKPVRKQIEIQ